MAPIPLKMTVMAVLAALILAFVSGCPQPSKTEIAAMKQRVAEGATLVDVRTPEEFADGHIEGAVNIPVDVIEKRMGEIPKDKPVVLYCAVGVRSGDAMNRLKKHGYDAYNLGAMGNWESAGQ